MKIPSVSRAAATLVILFFASSGFWGVAQNLFYLCKTEAGESSSQHKDFLDFFPAAKEFEEVRQGAGVLCYKALDRGDHVLGYVFMVSRHGYSSDIVTLAGMDKAGTLVRVKILSQNETPGLGARVTEPAFEAQFCGKHVDSLPGSVDAITGATITSSAVIASVQERGRAVLERMRNDG